MNICKPRGMTSFMAVKKLKQLFKGLKMGHLGTLDPMAEGVLPIAIGSATRLIPYISDHSKSYRAELVLGAVSDTQDIWGEVKWGQPVRIDIVELERELDRFRGSIRQVPPMFSAVHHQGQRLYQLARQGLEVERQERPATIYRLELVSPPPMGLEGYQVVRLEVSCSEGTYIRTLCHDLGQRLGCGAVMSALLRTACVVFSLEKAMSLEELKDSGRPLEEILLPAEMPLLDLPAVGISDAATLERLYNGNALEVQVPEGDSYVRIHDEERQRLAALGKRRLIGGRQMLQPVVVLKPQDGLLI